MKDRALRIFYQERRDAMVVEEEKERNEYLLAGRSFDSMSISDSSSDDEGTPLQSQRAGKRNTSLDDPVSRKRACL